MKSFGQHREIIAASAKICGKSKLEIMRTQSLNEFTLLEQSWWLIAVT